MSHFIGLTDSEILDYLGQIECELKDIKQGICDGEVAFPKKKHLCQDCYRRKECMDLEAQKVGLLMIMETRFEDYQDPDEWEQI